MPRWSDGLVDAFPIPADSDLPLSLGKLKISEDKGAQQDILSNNSDPFPFFDLPAELRNRVYNLVLFSKPAYRRADGTRKGSRLAVMLASKRFHQEASYALYTTDKFLIFPLQQFTPLPTIQQLPLHYRTLVTRVEMVLGSSWTKLPAWKVTPGLKRNLRRLKNVQTLSVFVEFDPSHPDFKVKQAIYEAYIEFCLDLVGDVLEAVPQIKYVQLDGNPGINVHGSLVSRLREEIEDQDKLIVWGKEASWKYKIKENNAEKA